MKELLESYVTEAVQLREQVELLARIVGLAYDAEGLTPAEIPLGDLVVAPPNIRVEKGVVYIG
jgi:hypothetical protein